MNKASNLQDYWEKTYESTTTPFDQEEPDEWIAALEKSGKIRGKVLDAGCGPGRTSIYLAGLGYEVLGVDISKSAIERAQRKAAAQGKRAAFLQADMCTLPGYENQFDTIVDIGCFHSLDEADRATYAAALDRMCRAGAVVYLRAFSDTNLKNAGQSHEGSPTLREEDMPKDRAVPALREEQIRTAFSSAVWIFDELVEREIDLYVSEEFQPRVFAWFAAMRRS